MRPPCAEHMKLATGHGEPKNMVPQHGPVHNRRRNKQKGGTKFCRLLGMKTQYETSRHLPIWSTQATGTLILFQTLTVVPVLHANTFVFKLLAHIHSTGFLGTTRN